MENYIIFKEFQRKEKNALEKYDLTPKSQTKKSNFLEVGIFMTKYNFELKKKVVLEYINENISIRSLAKKYNIKSHNNIILFCKKRILSSLFFN